MDIWLGPGDFVDAVTNPLHLELNSAAGTYATLTFDANPGPPAARSRTVSMMLNISHASKTGLVNAVRVLEAMLNRAGSGRRPSGITAGLVLSVRVDDSSEWVYFDVLSGQLGYPSRGLELLFAQQMDLPLQLVCLPYGRGDAITDSPVTVTGDDPVFTRAAIPGDCPALIQYTITDGSGGSKFLNRIRIAHRSLADLDDGDFDGYYDAAAISPATDGADTASFGDDIATLDSTDVDIGTWHDVAFATTPTAYADASGLFDIWARVADTNVTIAGPTLTLLSYSGGGSLPAGTYQCCVTALNAGGQESAASNIMAIVSPTTGLGYTYTAPVSGTPTNYRAYWKRDTQAWKYKAVGSAATTYTLTSESGATTADPPSALLASGHFRAQVSLESGTTKQTLTPATAQLSNGSKEWLFLGTAYVPPMALQEGGSARQGRVTVQANSPTAVDMLVDCVALLPHDEQQVVASYGSLNESTGLTLAALRKWVIGTTRHGVDYGILLSTADDSEEGQLSVLGPSVAGPGDTTLIFLMESQGGVSDISNMSLSVVLRIVPRYRFLTGSTP